MATKPKAILSTHDGREASPITKASNVLFENGQTAQDILNDRQDAMISPVIENSSSMFKVGQGDNVDYSANVVNGAYESMVLKGKSMVNCIQEPSSQDVVLPYEFEEGRYVTINDTKESGALGVELKGQTLVNISKPAIGNGNTVSTYANIGMTYYQPKSNTKYFCYIENLANDTFTYYLNNITFNLPTAELQRFTIEPNSIVTKIATTVENPDKYGLWLSVSSLNEATEKQNLRIMLIEYQEGMENWDLPYFEGMTSCKMPILKSVNQMFNYSLATKPSGSGTISFVNDGRSLKTNFDITRDCVNTTSITLPAGTYDISYRVRGSVTLPEEASLSSSRAGFTFFKSSETWYSSAAVTVSYANMSPTNYTRYSKTLTFDEPVTVAIVYHGWNNNPVGWCELTDIRIVPQGKSSILSLPEEVVLRSLPNGVCDTFNTRTSVYTQRIGEVVLNGENYTGFSKDSALENDTTCKYFISNFFSKYLNGKGGQNEKVVLNCNYLPPVSFNHMQDKTLSTYPCIANSGAGSLNLRVGKDIDSISLLLAYLQSNPITIQYELATPIITKINLPSTLKSWNTTTHIYSEIPENTLYPTLTHSNPTYPVILKPSTKYSIVANSYSNNHTNSTINFNLGGATASTTVGNRVTTITTPSTLSNELLTMSGRGNKLNNVMVIEGDVVGDEPYFEGICDSKSPILSNVGKNLFDVNQTPSYVTKNTTYSIANNEVTINSTGETNYPRIIYTLDKKLLGKTIFVSYDVVKNTSNNWILQFVYTKIDGTKDYKNCRVGIPITLPNEIAGDLTIGIYADNTSATGTAHTLILKNIQIEEGSVATPYEPYKSNILSCNGDKIELTKDMLEQGGFSAGSMVLPTYEQCKTSTNSTIRMRSKELIKVSPNTTYIVTNKTLNLNYTTYTFDSNRHFTGEASTTNAPSFTTSPSCQYIAIMFSKGNNSTVVTSDFKESEFQIYEVDKTIVLRSLPNGVCDTLNVETGEYVQRIGEVVCKGDSGETWSRSSNSDLKTLTSHFKLDSIPNPNSTSSRCNTLPYESNTLVDSETPSYKISGEIWLNVLKSNLVTDDANGLKKYLKTLYDGERPIIIQYELAAPVIKTVDISGYPFSYENGHVILSSGSIEQSLTPTVEYSVATNRNGQIRNNQKMVERHQKQLDQLQAIILANLVNSQYNQTLTTLKYELSRV